MREIEGDLLQGTCHQISLPPPGVVQLGVELALDDAGVVLLGFAMAHDVDASSNHLIHGAGATRYSLPLGSGPFLVIGGFRSRGLEGSWHSFSRSHCHIDVDNTHQPMTTSPGSCVL